MSPHVRLARLSLEHYLRYHRPLTQVPPDIAEALKGQRAGAFVSIHTREGDLRGCIGTLSPCRENLVEEILCNAISAGTQDYRFVPVSLPEMEDLAIKVDVLSEPEDIRSAEELDPRRYGVIVYNTEGRRGVLLPDLEGVDSVDDQIRIACRKAGIDPRGERYKLQRFTVERFRE
ncbi:AmmeMemoRadiSam system protein A [Holophaga foetida]|uniref:AmmeMemoRadiSam system protein A n=1 Tax=Holophaga foetida TaxID=35839 RepID=UPI0002474600|nr:AmmeMemoRadiSam system protein A [Holophaga foetida]